MIALVYIVGDYYLLWRASYLSGYVNWYNLAEKVMKQAHFSFAIEDKDRNMGKLNMPVLQSFW